MHGFAFTPPAWIRRHQSAISFLVVALLAQAATWAWPAPPSVLGAAAVATELDLSTAARAGESRHVGVERVASLHALSAIRVPVWGSYVTGRSVPLAPVTVTLRSGAGLERGLQTMTTFANGTFDVDLVDPAGRPVAIQPEDVLEVAEATGDPLLIRVPQLSARADLASGAIVGLAPPGTEVTVSVEYDADGDQGDVTRVTALTDDSGQFRADFAGQRALARGMGGQLVAVIRGVRFVAGWSAPRLAVDLGVSFLDTFVVLANVPAGQTARLRMTDAAGKLVLEAAQAAGFPPFPGFPGESCCMSMVNLRLRGPDGATVLPVAGDRMELAVGDELVAMTVDPLAATVFAAEDRIVGRTRPDTAVTVDVRRNPLFIAQGGRSVQLRSDADGRFEHAFGSAYDVRPHDRLVLTADLDGHVLRRLGGVPGLIFDLGEHTVAGALAPDATLTVDVQGGAGLRGSAVVRADADGRFVARPLDAAGAPVALEAGDQVSVRAEDGLPAEPISARVPRLTMRLDGATGTVAGTVDPGGEFAVQANRSEFLMFEGFSGVVRPTVGADGTYSAVLDPPRGLIRGSVVEARYRTAEDHVALLRRVVPMAMVQHGGATVCGSLPAGPVTARLLDAGGTELAQATGQVAPNQRFELTLRGPDGQLAVSRAGQSVRVEAGLDTLVVDLPEAHARLDALTGTVDGDGPPGAKVWVIDPADRCFYRDAPGRNSGYRFGGGGKVLGAEGRYRISNGAGMRPGDGMQVSFFLPDGHAFYLNTYRLQGRIFVGTPRVGGRVSAGLPVSARLLGPDGAARATGVTVAAADGRFELGLADAGGQAVASQPGDTVRLEGGGEVVDIAVSVLDFDYSLETGILGRAPAQATVRLDLELPASRQTFPRTADMAGAFTFLPADVPARSGWSLADVRLVRVTNPTSGGHEVVVEARLGENTAPTPTDPSSTGTPVVGTATATATGTATATSTSTPQPSATRPVFRGRAYLPRLHR